MNHDEITPTDEQQTRLLQSEEEPGRYSKRQFDTVDSPSVDDTSVFLKAKHSENVEYISGQLQQLYAHINQHIIQKLNDIEHKNQEIDDLVANLNAQVRNVLNQ